MIDTFAASLTVRAIGWGLVQSLWQGALIGAVTALTLMALRHSAASRRYWVACAGLLAIVALAIMTAAAHARDRRTGAILTETTVRSVFASQGVRTDRFVSDTRVGEPSRPVALPTSGELWSDEWMESWSVIAVPLWLLGVLALSSRLLAGWFFVERVRRAATQTVPAAWRSTVQTLAHRLRMTRPVCIIESTFVHVPMVIGWLRPVILLPASALTGLSASQLEAVIAHELAHVQRHDYLVNMLQMVVETLFFYHPATWWISRQIRLEREHCCDDVAVALCGDPVTYARALADLEERRREDVTFALAVTGGPLIRRIRRLLGVPLPNNECSPTWIVVGAILTVLSLLWMREDVRRAAVPDLSAVAMPRTQATPGDESVIRGRIVDARSGRPVAGASVELSGDGRLASASTDGDGRYEVRGLRPGEYHLSVQAMGYVPAQYGQRDPAEEDIGLEVRLGQTISGVDVRLQLAGVMNGRILGDSGEGLPGVEVELLSQRYLPGGPAPVPVAFAQTGALGTFRVDELQPGEYFIRAYAPPRIRPSRGQGQVYASTYFPQATRIGDAQPVLLNAGQELLDVDFAMVTVGVRVVSGRLIDPTGPPLEHAQVVMMPLGGSTRGGELTTAAAPDGRFEIRNVVPGQYFLRVHDPVFWQAPAQFTRWFAAKQLITVVDDLSGVELVAHRGARLEGRIVRDSGSPLPFDPRSIRVGFAQWMESRPGIPDFTSEIGPLKIEQADGSFSIESPGGPSSMRVSGVPPGWIVKAIRLEGVDITEQAADFGEGVRRQLDIVLTDRVSNVGGVVTDRDSRAVSSCTVVVFPTERARWTPQLRLVRAVRPHQNGSYQIDALPPGNYLAIAVESLPRNAWNDPNVLDRLSPLATRFRLGEGEQRTLQLKLSPTPDGLLAEQRPTPNQNRLVAVLETLRRGRP